LATNLLWRRSPKEKKVQCQGAADIILTLIVSYLEGVTAPDGPILDKPERVKDGKLGETAL
jgi:hypothetical protein